MTSIQAQFAPGFMNAYAKTVVMNPAVGLREIIVNSWDAGAENVFVSCPDAFTGKGTIEVRDDGSGMTREEFESIWPVASYNRVENHGHLTYLSDGTVRKTFGSNGIGRFGMFCFSDSYHVETWRDGERNCFDVKMSSKGGNSPYEIEHVQTDRCEGHGTRIWCRWDNPKSSMYNPTTIASDMRNTLFDVSKFNLYVNKSKVEFPVIDGIRFDSKLDSGEPIIITRCDIRKLGFGRTGVWIRVNGRVVGEPSWDGTHYKFNLKRDEIKHYFVIVDADFLCEYVSPDWTGFQHNERFKGFFAQIMKAVDSSITDIVAKIRADRRDQAYLKNLPALRDVSPYKREVINDFVETIIDECPSADGETLSKVVELLAKMEKSRSKYMLMSILAKASPQNIDDLSDILSKWTIAETKAVFDVLSDRIDTVNDLRKIVDKLETLEVSQLQPIFERNLWMFGPEFDSCSFTSNMTLTTVLKKLGTGKSIKEDKRRPDFVISPNSSIATYTADSYDYGDSNGDVRGYASIVIVELKKGGFHVTTDEMSQAVKYGQAIQNSGMVAGNPRYMCYVLGSKVDSELTKPGSKIGDIGIQCLPYQVLLNAAEARLMGLIKKFEKLGIEKEYNDSLSQLLDSHPDVAEFSDSDRN